MALSKVTIVDKMEVLEKGQVQVRTVTRIIEDEVELSSSYHRHVVDPQVRTGYVKGGSAGTWAATDITGEDARVQAICTAAWTTEVIAAYKAMVLASD